MFEAIYSRPADIRRHGVGPLSRERSDYLRYLADRGASTQTLRNKASYPGLGRLRDAEMAY